MHRRSSRRSPRGRARSRDHHRPALLRVRHRRRAARRRSPPTGSPPSWDQNGALYVMSPAAAVIEEVAAGVAARSAAACRRARASASSPAATWRTSPASPPRATRCCAAPAGTSRRDGLQRRAARRASSSATRCTSRSIGALRLLGLGVDAVDARRRGRPGPHARRRARGARSPATSGPTDRLRAGRQREHGRVRSARRDRRRRAAGTARGCTSTARSGCGPRPVRALRHHVRRHRARRLVGDRRAQVAERALRLRPRVRRAPGGASRGDEPAARAYLDAAPTRSRASRWTGRRSRRAARAASPSTPRCARSAGAASPTSSTAAAALARRFAERLRQEPTIRILNDVVLNQVLVRVVPPAATPTRRHATRCGSCRTSASAGSADRDWHGMDAMRISVSNWSTTEDDIDRSADSIIRAVLGNSVGDGPLHRRLLFISRHRTAPDAGTPSPSRSDRSPTD